MKVGERIQKRRKELGMTVDDLAEKVGKSRATVYRYENGSIEKLPLEVVTPFAEALDLDPGYLMGWTDDPKQKRFYMTFQRKHSADIMDKVVVEKLEHIVQNSDYDALTFIEKFSQLNFKDRKETIDFIDFKLSQYEGK